MNNLFKNSVVKYFIATLFFLFFLISCHRSKPQNFKSKSEFIDAVMANVKIINDRILLDRKHLLTLQSQYKDRKPLHSKEKKWLIKLAENYKLKSFDINKPQAWDMLKSRVDILPASLVTAQAIYESRWGKSRFAYEGNNYFGLYCFKKGCGMVPLKRPENAVYELRYFNNMQESISAYIHTINTLYAYQELRKLRAEERLENKKLNALLLAEALDNYSEQEIYEVGIKNIIRQLGQV